MANNDQVKLITKRTRRAGHREGWDCVLPYVNITYRFVYVAGSYVTV